jgi:acylphosphatase
VTAGRYNGRAMRDTGERPPLSSADRARLHLAVSGRVQAVGFRASTAEQARALGLSGWVRNRPDGGVEVEAEGPRPTVERLLAWCQHGPPHARVDAVMATWIAVTGASDGFFVRR